MIPEPHGGTLVDRFATDRRAGQVREEVAELPALHLSTVQQLDAEKIAVGALSPLTGFQGEADVEAVIATGRLPEGLPWPVPAVLALGSDAQRSEGAQARPGHSVALADTDGRPFGRMDVVERFRLHRRRFAQRVYGTTDPSHPNVAELANGGGEALAGPVELFERTTAVPGDLERTPSEMRAEFARRGWNSVAAFTTRSLPHRAHEQLHRLTLERDDVDALLIHPLVGPLQPGDYLPGVVVAGYRALIEHYYPAERVLLATLGMGMRYAGPRGALFLAIVRKNFGCSHYIVGRDQAGFGGLFDPYDCHRAFDRFDLGIVPVRYRESFLCWACGGMASPKTCGHMPMHRAATSQARIRDALARREELPEELLRPEVASVLRRSTRVFHDPRALPAAGRAPSLRAPRSGSNGTPAVGLIPGVH